MKAPRPAGPLLALLVLGCAPERERAAAHAAPIGVDVQWSATDRCSPRSPAVSLQGIPPGAARIRVRLTDLNMPTFSQGSDVFVPPGGRIAPGTLPNYAGPCPPAGERHSFRLTVDALDASGQIIGTGQATHLLPPE